MFFPFCKKKKNQTPIFCSFKATQKWELILLTCAGYRGPSPRAVLAPLWWWGRLSPSRAPYPKIPVLWKKKNITLLGYNKRKRRINEHIVSKIAIEIKLLWSALGEGDAPTVLEEEEEDEEENGEREWRRRRGGGTAVQCERAASTVTKQQSSKSALALRTVNPSRAILISTQRWGEAAKIKHFKMKTGLLYLWEVGRNKKKAAVTSGGVSSCGAPVQADALRPVRLQPEVSAPRTAYLPVSSSSLRPAPPLPSLPLSAAAAAPLPVAANCKSASLTATHIQPIIKTF